MPTRSCAVTAALFTLLSAGAAWSQEPAAPQTEPAPAPAAQPPAEPPAPPQAAAPAPAPTPGPEAQPPAPGTPATSAPVAPPVSPAPTPPVADPGAPPPALVQPAPGAAPAPSAATPVAPTPPPPAQTFDAAQFVMGAPVRTRFDRTLGKVEAVEPASGAVTNLLVRDYETPQQLRWVNPAWIQSADANVVILSLTSDQFLGIAGTPAPPEKRRRGRR